MSKKWLLSLSLAVLISLIAACGGTDDTDENNIDPQEEDPVGDIDEEAAPDLDDEGQFDMPQPDLDSIPDVVAVVNGDEITKEEFENVYVGQFQQASMEAMMYGQEFDQDDFKLQVIDALVGQELLVQEANSRDFDITQNDMDSLLEDLAAQYGFESKDEFLEVMEEQGTSEEELNSILETQVKIDKLIASEAGEFTTTDEELEETYDQMLTQYLELGGEEDIDLPTFEEMKPELEQQARMQHENDAYRRLVGELRENADVTINI
ncbi:MULTISPECIES: SurA N-terminal domain-containing protein [Bacillaceae]|uniref:SurA N-terminal domain-containing protein n=1 Tax=Evansella alkalicola TaxID=745819 RepID=A0ABS6JU60_9BACI|nr:MULTISPECIES: SurA N-terminal domain-containing protein [Bacillaceae]MBU9722105.1 SurA N-terminal domain-containing protein [Bacillus alkalicola]